MRLMMGAGRYYLEPDTSSEQAKLASLTEAGRGAKLEDVSTCDLNDALIRREGDTPTARQRLIGNC